MKHSLVCDSPSHGFVFNNTCSEQDPAEAILHVQCLWPGEFADEEIYGSSGQLTQGCRKENLHFWILP
ncbi:hypothetical protein HU200_027861 [Digitaria exilis]|uniref:Uncharacterized protein n=1 Tax=Digitaria exilis TaxID=1010633 RepID=A0A835BSU5_9POAL|nr:hypothetical protein HU200_027861 [Digitaria exilis]